MTKSKEQKSIHRLLNVFNIAGIIHTTITVCTVALVILFILSLKPSYITAIEVLSTITWFNSLIWLICGIILVVKAKKLNNPVSVARTRMILIAAICLLLVPDTLLMILSYTPVPETNEWIGLVYIASPICGFIGWFIGRRIGKKIKQNEK